MPVFIYCTPTKAEKKQSMARRAAERSICHWGKMLKELREEQSLSQRELATLAAVNRNALRKLEKDPAGASFEIVEKIAAVLGYEFDLMAIQKSPYANAAA